MKKFFIAFIVFLAWSLIILWVYSLFQDGAIVTPNEAEVSEKSIENPPVFEQENIPTPSNQLKDTIPVKDTVITSEKEKKTIPQVSVLDANGNEVFVITQGFTVQPNSSKISIPESSRNFKYKINTYLLEHPDQEIHISSVYSPKENTETPNFGLQRGNAIKDILIQTGVPEGKIVVKPIIKNIDLKDESAPNNFISFSFGPLDVQRIEKMKSSISEAPKKQNSYFIFSDTGSLVNKELDKLIRDVKKINTENPAVNIQVIGHTDNIGNSTDNYQTALGYAQEVRNYLINNGIPASKIKASSKGEAEPQYSNSTEKGRNNNRRIEVTYN